MRTTHYDPTDIGSTFQDAVSMLPNTLSESSHPRMPDSRHQDQPCEPLHSIARVREVLPYLKGRFKTPRALPHSKDDPEELYPQPPSNSSWSLTALSALLIALTLTVDIPQPSCCADDCGPVLNDRLLPSHDRSTMSSARSQQPSSSSTSSDTTLPGPNHSRDRLDCSHDRSDICLDRPNHSRDRLDRPLDRPDSCLDRSDCSFDYQDRLPSATQATARSLLPEDRLRDSVTLVKTPQGLSSTPEGPGKASVEPGPMFVEIDSYSTPQQLCSTPEQPDKVSIEPSPTPVDIDSYTTPIPSGKSPFTSFASCVQSVPSVSPVHTPSALHTTRRHVHNINDDASSTTDVPRASTTVATKLTCSEAPSTSYLHSHDDTREVGTRSKAHNELRHSGTSSSSYTNDSDCLRNHTMRLQPLVSKDTKPRSTSKASTTTTSDPERLNASLSSDLHAHNDLHAPYMRAEIPVRTSCASVTTLKTSTTPKSRSEYDCNDDTMQSHPCPHKEPRASSFHSEKLPNVYNEALVLLLNPRDYSFSDRTEIYNYLPYAPNTPMYTLSSGSAKRYEFMPASAGLTSAVRRDKEANYYRKIYRRLGRDLYSLSLPTFKETRYPSRSCEEWASHIFKLLDAVVTFRPTCYISNRSNELIPAQEIDYWPEYGELYLAYSQLINQSLTRQSEYDRLLPIPEWPASDHIFLAKAFEVAAVSFRDQMERSIQKLYDIITIESTDHAPSTVLSRKEYEDPMQEEFESRVTQLDSDSSQVASHPHTTALPLLESTPQDFSSHSSRHSSSYSLHRSIKSQQTLPSPQELTPAARADDNIQSIQSPRLTTGSQATRPHPKPPDHLEKLLEELRRLEQPMAQLTGATLAPTPEKLKETLSPLKPSSQELPDESLNTICIRSISDLNASAPAVVSTKLNVKDRTHAITVAQETDTLASRTSTQRNSLGQGRGIVQDKCVKSRDIQEAFDSSVSTSNDATNTHFPVDTIAPTAHTCTSTRSKRPTMQCATTAPISNVNSTSLGTHAQGSTQYVEKLSTPRFIRSEKPPSHESLDNRPRTPSKPQDNSSIDASSSYKAITPPIEPLPQESSRNPTHRTTESQYTPPPLALTAPEAVDNNINYSSSLTRTISSQIIHSSATPTVVATRGLIDDTLAPIGFPESTTESQVPVVELTLLDNSNWFTDVMSHLDRLVQTDTRVHTPVERQANRITSSLATDNHSQQRDRPLGSSVSEQIPEPVAKLAALPVPTLPPEPVAQERLCDTLPNTPKRRHVSRSSTLTTSGTMEDHKLIDESNDISIYSTLPLAIDRPAEANYRPEHLVISCASANHAHIPTIMLPPTTVNRSASPDSNVLSNDITKRPRKPSVTRSQDSLVSLLSTERPKALVQAPSKLPDELRCSRHDHSPSLDLRPLAPDQYTCVEEQESVRASPSFADTSALDRHAESVNRSLPTPLSREIQDSPRPDAPSSLTEVVIPYPSPTTRITRASTTKLRDKALYRDISDEEQVSNRLQYSPSPVGLEELGSTHICVPTSSTDALGSTSSATTRATPTLVADRVPTTLVSNLSDSPKSVSVEVSNSLYKYPSSSSTNASVLNASAATHTTHAQVVEPALNAPIVDNRQAPSLRTSSTSSRSPPIDPPLQIDILTEPSFEVSAQFTASSIKASDCSIKTSTQLIERNNDIIADPSLRKVLSTESTPDPVKRPSNEPPIVSDEVLTTSEERIEPSNDNNIDFSLNHEVPADPTCDRFAQLIIEPSIALNLSTTILNELNEHKNNCIIDRTSLPLTVAAEDPKSPHIFAPPDPVNPADFVHFIASTATQTTSISVAESKPGRPAEHQRDQTRSTVPDLPSRADHPDRQTSFDAPRHASAPGTVDPINLPVEPSSVGSEEEQSRRTIPSVEPTRSPPSKHRHRPEALPFEEPNTSQTAHSLAPPRPHIAARPVTPARRVAPVQPVNIHESPTYLRSRLANSRQLSELIKYDVPGEQWNDRLEPTQVEREGGTNLSIDNSGKNQQVSQDRVNHSPGKPPNKPGDHFDNNSDFESHRFDPQPPEDRSDHAYTYDIESKISNNELAIDQKSSEQHPARKTRRFARSACAYTPIDSDATALYSEGDMFDLNSVSTRKSARSPAKRVNLYTHNVPNPRISGSETRMPEIPRPLELKQRTAANFDPDGTFMEIDLIQAHKPPLKEPEPLPLVQQFMLLLDQQCPVEPVNSPISKFRDVVTGGDTWDIADLEKKLEELLTNLGGLKISIFKTPIEHDALPWIQIFDVFLCKLLIRPSTFPIDPGIRTLKKANSNASITRTPLEYLSRLLRTNRSLSTVHNQSVSMIKVLGNPAERNVNTILIKLRHSSDLNKILSEYSCSEHTSPHTCTDQDRTTRSCELQHRMSTDSTAQLFQRTQQASFDDLAKLVTAYIELALQSPANAAIDNPAQALPPCKRPRLLTTDLQAQTPRRTYWLVQVAAEALAGIALEAPANQAWNDGRKHLIGSSHSSDAPVHECIDRTRTVPPCELNLLVKLDPSAETVRRLNQLMQGVQSELTNASQEFTLG